jgi:hypothetical protein
MDTGATDHLTNDIDRLSVQERYHGKIFFKLGIREGADPI